MGTAPSYEGTRVARSRIIRRRLGAQHLLHRSPLRQLVDELVEVPDLPHQRILDLLDPYTTDDAGDLADVRMQRRGFGEEGLEVRFALDLFDERLRGVT